jgi:hypothetical protein
VQRKELTFFRNRQLQEADGSIVVQTRQTRNPLIPSSTTHFEIVSIFSRFVTTCNDLRAAFGSMQGTKKEVPFLNRFQFI